MSCLLSTCGRRVAGPHRTQEPQSAGRSCRAPGDSAVCLAHHCPNTSLILNILGKNLVPNTRRSKFADSTFQFMTGLVARIRLFFISHEMVSLQTIVIYFKK